MTELQHGKGYLRWGRVFGLSVMASSLGACAETTGRSGAAYEPAAEGPWGDDGASYVDVAAPAEPDAGLAPATVVEPDASSEIDAPIEEPEPAEGESEPVVPDEGPCDGLGQRWVEIAQTHCAACHGLRSAGLGGFFTVLDVDALVASGKVVPGEPDASPLFGRLSAGTMPPASRVERPTQGEIAEVRAWIECGAPEPSAAACTEDCTTFVDIDARIDLMLKDLSALDAPEERADLRYLDLSAYANAGHGDAEIELYRDGLSFLVNSLSREPEIVVPQAIDPQNLIFRLRLSDYGWDAATWDRIVEDYPYEVAYDADSRSFPVDEAYAERLREQTAEDTPYVQGDWFFSVAVRAPLYYDILGMPATLSGLEAQLGVDIAESIQTLTASRAGMQLSGPSSFNRVVEHHPVGADGGSLWLTYDFVAGAGASNVITHPLDFQAAGNEIFFSLPNGLHAYMITDGAGARLEKAPNDAVQDPLSADLAIEAGISCISCHAETGPMPVKDEVRKAAALTTANADELNRVLALYPTDAERDALIDAAAARYGAALEKTRVHGFVTGSAHTLDAAFSGLLDFRDVAGVLGVDPDRLSEVIAETPRLFPSEILALRAAGAGIPRQSFDLLFADLVQAMGLGTAKNPR